MQVSEVSNMIEDLGEVSGPTFHAEFPTKLVGLYPSNAVQPPESPEEEFWISHVIKCHWKHSETVKPCDGHDNPFRRTALAFERGRAKAQQKPTEED